LLIRVGDRRGVGAWSQLRAAAPQQLQVLAVKVPVRAEPSAKSLPVAELSRGAVASVLEQRGDWYKVPLDAQRSGWVEMAPAEYGEMTLFVFDAPAGVAREGGAPASRMTPPHQASSPHAPAPRLACRKPPCCRSSIHRKCHHRKPTCRANRCR
jgi:hypothetical protein